MVHLLKKVVEILLLAVGLRSDRPRPSAEESVLWIAVGVLFVCGLKWLWELEGQAISSSAKLMIALGSVVATDGPAFYLNARLKSRRSGQNGATLDTAGFLDKLIGQAEYLGTAERDTLRDLLTMLTSGDKQRIWNAAVWLWRLRSGPRPDSRTSQVVVTRDESDCLDGVTLEPSPQGLAEIRTQDWLTLIEMSKSRYYTVIHGDLRIWEGKAGTKYFRSHRKLLRSGAIVFKRLFAFPTERDLSDAVARLEGSVEDTEADRIADLCARGANDENTFNEVDAVVSDIYDRHPLQGAARELASRYLDMALLTRAVLGHAKAGIEHLVADTRLDWDEQPEDVIGIAGKDRRFVIEGSSIAPGEHGPVRRTLLSAASIDDVSIIRVYGGTARAEVDFAQAPVIYDVRSSGQDVSGFAAAFDAIWAYYERCENSGGRSPFFKGELDRLKEFLSGFSPVFARKIDGIRPMKY